MIFQATHQQVLDGTKTQTRRPVKPNEHRAYEGPDGIFYYLPDKPSYIPTVIIQYPISLTGPDCRMKWQVGRTYAVQPGRGKKSIGRIRITKIRRERLREISFSDIRAEGVPSEPLQRFAFEQLWNSLYRKPYRWEDNPEVWVLEFETVKEEEDD